MAKMGLANLARMTRAAAGLVLGLVLGLDLALGGHAGARAGEVAAPIPVRILATTDIHSYLMDYDYYRDRPDPAVGLVRVAGLIRAARAEQANAILVDAGDLIQGSPLADAIQRGGLRPGQVHPALMAMNSLAYDAATIGNHEFNYGLGYLETALAGARFPYVCGNVLKVGPDGTRPLVAPTLIIERRFRDLLGSERKLRIGLLGSTPPQILNWDRDKLNGKIKVRDQLEAAREGAARLRAQGADIVVMIAHTGMGPREPAPMDEHSGWAFTTIPEIDAVVLGHSHRVFPSEGYGGTPAADLSRGTINGKPVVMAGFYGSHLGVIDLVLAPRGRGYAVASGRAEARAIMETDEGRRKPLVEPDADLVAALRPAHEAAIAYARSPVARTRDRIETYLTMVGDTGALGIVQDTLRSWAKARLAGTPLATLPILTAMAPFKAGGRYGASNYTDIAPGPLLVRDVVNLYQYPNTATVVRITGAGLREWLEMASRVFNRIDPAKAEVQPLLDPWVPSYYFDVIDGVTYAIDLTQPTRYDGEGRLAHPEAHRILDLSRDGKPIQPEDEFLVVTNNYRADGGGTFPGLDGTRNVLASTETIQDILVQSLQAGGEVAVTKGPIWRFAPIEGEARVSFDVPTAVAGLAARDERLERVAEVAGGFTRFHLRLNRAAP